VASSFSSEDTVFRFSPSVRGIIYCLSCFLFLDLIFVPIGLCSPFHVACLIFLLFFWGSLIFDLRCLVLAFLSSFSCVIFCIANRSSVGPVVVLYFFAAVFVHFLHFFFPHLAGGLRYYWVLALFFSMFLLCILFVVLKCVVSGAVMFRCLFFFLVAAGKFIWAMYMCLF